MQITTLGLTGALAQPAGQNWLQVQVLIEPGHGTPPDHLLLPADVDELDPLDDDHHLLLGSGFVHIDEGDVMDLVQVLTRDGRTLVLRRGPLADRPMPDGAWQARAMLHYVPAPL